MSFLVCYAFLNCVNSQSLIPQDLYDAGINLGYLEVFSGQGAEEETWPVWAANAGAEWASAWGLSDPLTPSPPYPYGAFTTRNTMIQYMMTNASGQCLSPYNVAAISIFEAGYYMGSAFAQTNFTCVSCVQSSLYNYAVALENMGRTNMPGSAEFFGLADASRTLSNQLNNLSNTEIQAALLDAAAIIQAAITSVNSFLPNEPIPCSTFPGEGLPPQAIDMSLWKVDFGPFKSSRDRVDAKPSGDGKTSYYIAPDNLHGNWSGINHLILDKMSWGGSYYGPNSYAAFGDVIIYSGRHSARYDIQKDHSKSWKTYRIPLRDSGGWIIKGDLGLHQILRNVTALKIRAEYGAGTDYSSLRNVKLVR